MTTHMTDFRRSKVLANGNKFYVVFNIESRTEVFDEDGESIDEFLQCELCRSEKVFHDYPLFTVKQHPYVPVFSRNGGSIFRSTTKGRSVDFFYSQGEMLGGYKVHIERLTAIECRDMRELSERAVRFDRLFARTTIPFGSKHRAVIEYPIKTINVSRDTTMSQIDTGPVAFPLFEEGKSLLECVRLAHVTCFEPNKVNFLVKTEIRECACEKEKFVVFDYGENVVMDAETKFFYAE